jgi:hypothetical protein
MRDRLIAIEVNSETDDTAIVYGQKNLRPMQVLANDGFGKG